MRKAILWLVIGLLAGPATATVVWLASAAGFVVLPGSAPTFRGQQGREGDFTEMLATADQTGGAIGIVRQSIAPNGGPPAHTHGGEDEFLYIESGNFRVRLGDKIMDAPAHTLLFVPRGTAHAFTNTGGEPGVVLVGVTPGGFEKMFQERQGVDAKTNADLMKMHKMEIVGPKVQ
jgi:mannose-6-phosphate isomerase-like protein (cupin superfamily)